MKIVSWNIGGGRPIKSSAQWDYQKENLRYFADELKKIDPDVICLQESLLNSKRSLAHELADFLSIPNVFETSARHKAGHIDPDYDLAMAILSKNPMSDESVFNYPDPWFDLFWPNGKKVEGEKHHKFLQRVKIQDAYIANTQLQPLKIFGDEYTEGEGAQLAQKVDQIMTASLEAPLIFCGDFNFDQPSQILPKLFSKISLHNALPTKPTRPINTKPDHIFFSNEFICNNSQVIETSTDHYLCTAELLYK